MCFAVHRKDQQTERPHVIYKHCISLSLLKKTPKTPIFRRASSGPQRELGGTMCAWHVGRVSSDREDSF